MAQGEVKDMAAYQSELAVITKAKDLCSYVMTVTDKSPKRFRFTLAAKLRAGHHRKPVPGKRGVCQSGRQGKGTAAHRLPAPGLDGVETIWLYGRLDFIA